MGNIKAPCIRGLKRFEKNGCPECSWNESRQKGCPAWSELIFPDPENPHKKKSEGNCLDVWQLKFQYSSLGLLEGNQKAVESFRNGMVEADGKGGTRPKMDVGTSFIMGIAGAQVKKLKQ